MVIKYKLNTKEIIKLIDKDYRNSLNFLTSMVEVLDFLPVAHYLFKDGVW